MRLKGALHELRESTFAGLVFLTDGKTPVLSRKDTYTILSIFSIDRDKRFQPVNGE